MTIASEIQRIQTNIANAYDAAEAKGATIPVTENSDNLATTIASITGGGGETITATNTTGALVANGSKVWINKSGNSYNIVDYYGNSPDFAINGTLTINNKIASGFSGSNCLLISPSGKPAGSISSMEMIFKIHTPTSNSWKPNGRIINGRYDYDDFALDISQTNASFCFISADGSSNKYIHVAPSGLSSDTDYWIKVVFDGTDLIGYYSLDGETYTEQERKTREASDLFIRNDGLSIGNRYMSSGSYPICVWNGSIDLSESYIKINGADWWTPYLCSVNQESLTGVAKEDITVSSSGEVLTVLES